MAVNPANAKLQRVLKRMATQGKSPLKLALEAGKITFFSAPYMSLADRWERVMFNKLGAEVQRSANRSMVSVRDKRFKGKQRVPAAPPGRPPRSRVGHLRKFNFYSYERGTVTIGPWKLPGMRQAIPAPGLHEHGGVMDVAHWGEQGLKKVFPRRPFMAPALERTMSRFNAGRIRFNFRY